MEAFRDAPTDRANVRVALVQFIVNGFGVVFLVILYLNYLLLKPWFAPIFWGAACSVPLHTMKDRIISQLDEVLFDEGGSVTDWIVQTVIGSFLKFLFGQRIGNRLMHIFNKYMSAVESISESQGQAGKVIHTKIKHTLRKHSPSSSDAEEETSMDRDVLEKSTPSGWAWDVTSSGKPSLRHRLVVSSPAVASTSSGGAEADDDETSGIPATPTPIPNTPESLLRASEPRPRRNRRQSKHGSISNISENSTSVPYPYFSILFRLCIIHLFMPHVRRMKLDFSSLIASLKWVTLLTFWLVSLHVGYHAIKRVVLRKTANVKESREHGVKLFSNSSALMMRQNLNSFATAIVVSVAILLGSISLSILVFKLIQEIIGVIYMLKVSAIRNASTLLTLVPIKTEDLMKFTSMMDAVFSSTFFSENFSNSVVVDAINSRNLVEAPLNLTADIPINTSESFEQSVPLNDSYSPFLTVLRIFKSDGIAAVLANTTLLSSAFSDVKSTIAVHSERVSGFASSGSQAFLSFIMSILDFIWLYILFLATLYYLVSAKHNLIHYLGRVISPLDPDQKFRYYLERSVIGVFSAAVKMATFHGLLTWLTFQALDIELTYIHVVLSIAIATLPVSAPFVVVIPMAIWLFYQWRFLACIILIGTQLWATIAVDPVIYSDIPNVHPFYAGLVVLLGKWAFGWGGIIIGPLVFFSVPAMYRLLLERIG